MVKKITGKAKQINEEYGHLIPYKNFVIPKEHRYDKDNPHSLRCFKMIWQRDSNDKPDKSLPKKRCKNHVVEGSLFCKFHGGQSFGISRKKDELPSVSQTAKAYKDLYDAELGDLLISFLNDPKILDLKPELASLRMILSNYITKLMREPETREINAIMSSIEFTCNDVEKSVAEKYHDIREIILSQESLDDGRAIDRINRCVKTISDVIEKIRKYENEDNYMLTPEGLKIMLRAIVELLNKVVSKEEERSQLREEFLKLSIETKGDLTKLSEKTIIDVQAE